jgi:hypothetical protein
MANKEFEGLIERRKDWVRSSKENKFDFDSILAGLYNDLSHCSEGTKHANQL